MSRSVGRRIRGFSLFEVVIALAVLLALSAALFGFFFGLLQQRDRIEVRGEQEMAASMLLERLESDLMCVIAGASEAGISGANDRLRILSRGVTPALTSKMVALGDLQGTEFRFEASSGMMQIRRWDVLASGEEGEFADLGAKFERVRFRYFVDRAWQGQFDSAAAGGLPVAIEVAIWFAPDRPVEEDEALAAGDGMGMAGDDEMARGEELDGRLDADAMMQPLGIEDEEREVVLREPDRLRVIVIPDGPPEGLALSSEEGN